MSLVYWDTMLFVYWLDEHPLYAERVPSILSRMEDRKDTLLHQFACGRRDARRFLQDRRT